MNTFYVVASSEQQRSLRLPAAQLYLSELFSLSITHARRFASRESDVRILSPKFGLLSQSRPLHPYDLQLSDLDPAARAHLIEVIRGELPVRGTLPLRAVLLAQDDDVALYRAACLGTPFETVPLRTPLANLSFTQQLRWLRAATWPIECDAELPATQVLNLSEDEHLRAALREAATWWSGQLLRSSPPPDPSLFASALALELHKVWEEVASKSRGEWPEDIHFPINSQDEGGPIDAAFEAIGLSLREWRKREGATRPLKVSMRFSMARVTVQSEERETILFPEPPS